MRLLGLALVLAALLSPVDAKKKKSKNPADDMVEMPMDAEVGKAEADALGQALGSGKMEGKQVTGRKIAKDGKSGMIQFGDPNGEKELWTPKFVVNTRDLEKLYTTEDYVLVYFFSTEGDGNLQASHSGGKPFEEAAQALLEGELEVSLVMVDMAKVDPQPLKEIGVTRPHTYRLFVNGKPKEYRGPREAKGIIAYMQHHVGPASVKIETSAALDELLESNSSVTNVVGVFGPAYEGSSMREKFADAARDLRDTGRLHFYEVSTYTARGAKKFAAESFDTSESAMAVVKPAKWVGKAEVPYALTTDFRSVHKFVKENCWSTVAPLSETFVSYAHKALGKTHMAVLLVDTRAQAKYMRYIVKQMHKMHDMDSTLSRSFSISIAERRPRLDMFIANRFDRTTIGRTFYQAEKFEDEFVHDFTVVVVDLNDVPPPKDPHDFESPPGPPTTRNWVTNVLARSKADSLDIAKLVPFLKGVVSGEIPPLPQGDAAAPAAGLKEMKMGFGGDGMEEVGAPKKRKRKKGSKLRMPNSPDDVKDEM